MKLTLEQFETQWAESNLSTTDWFDTTYGLFKELETLQSRSCEGCKYFNQMLNYDDCDKGVADNVQILNDAVYATVSLNFCCNRYEAKEQL